MAEKHQNTFRLVIASVGETLFDGAAASVTLPGTDGVLTILPNHEPFVTTLKQGTIFVKTGSESKEFPVNTGVLECTASKAVVLL